ncbi:hypothetical protein Tco_1506979 [Tanacetum coccineum]
MSFPHPIIILFDSDVEDALSSTNAPDYTPALSYSHLSTIYRMAPKRRSTSETPAMTQAAIRQLIADGVTTALEVQAPTMANTDNPNRNMD